MSEYIERINTVTESFDKLNENDKQILNMYLLDNIEAFKENPTETIRSGFQYLRDLLIKQFIEDSSKEIAKKTSLNDSVSIEKSKAIVDSLSSQIKMNQDMMEQGLNETKKRL